MDAPTHRQNEGMGTVGSRSQGWQCLWRTVRADTLEYTGRRRMRGHIGNNCCCVHGLVSGEVLSGNTGAESLVCKPGKERYNGDALSQAVPKPQTKTMDEQKNTQRHRVPNKQEELLLDTHPTLYDAQPRSRVRLVPANVRGAVKQCLVQVLVTQCRLAQPRKGALASKLFKHAPHIHRS